MRIARVCVPGARVNSLRIFVVQITLRTKSVGWLGNLLVVGVGVGVGVGGWLARGDSLPMVRG
jgi:hypothetical protein